MQQKANPSSWATYREGPALDVTRVLYPLLFTHSCLKFSVLHFHRIMSVYLVSISVGVHNYLL